MAQPLTPARAGLAAALVVLAGGALTLNHMLVGVFYDDGLYAGIAYALSHGQGYVHPNLPGHPAVVHYPPLYPLLLTPLFGTLSVQGAGFAAKVLNVLCAAVGAGLIAAHAARAQLLGPGGEAPPWLGAALVVAAAIALPMLTVLSVLFSEPLFGLLLAVAVILADRPPPFLSPDRATLLAGVAAALSLLTRSIGVAAGAGIVLYLLVVRRTPWQRAALAGAPVFIAGLAWGLWVLRHRGGIDPEMATDYGSYFEALREAGPRAVWQSLGDLPRPLADLTLRWLPGAALTTLFGIAALLMLLYGIALLVRRSSIGFMLVGYLAILAIWPFPADRFIWAVLPWLALAWAAAAMALWQRVDLRRLRPAVVLVAAAVVAGYAQLEVRGLLGGWWRGAPALVSNGASEMLPALEALPPNAVLAADFEPLFWLHTGRLSVPFYTHGYRGRDGAILAPARQRAYLERQGATYVMISGYGSESARELDALLGAYPGWLTIVKRWRGGRVLFQVNPGH